MRGGVLERAMDQDETKLSQVQTHQSAQR